MIKYIIYIYSLITFLCIISCVKEKDNNNINNEVSLSFQVAGVSGIVSDVASIDDKMASTNFQNTSAALNEKLISQNIHTDEYDFFLGHTELSLAKSSKKELLAHNQPLYPSNYDPIGSGVSRPLENNVKYRVLVFKASDDSYVGTIDATVGTVASRLVVDGGVEYKWFAYSYNSDNSLPAIDISNPKTAVANEDFIYASGVIEAVTGEKKIPITFERKMATIQVLAYTTAFSAYGYFDNWGEPSTNPNATYVKLSNLVGGDFNLLSGEFIPSSFSTITDPARTIINTKKSGVGAYLPDPNAASTSVTGYAYTIPNTASLNTVINVRLGIKMHYNPSVIRFIEPLSGPIPFNNVKTEEGVLSRIYIMPMDKTIGVGNPSSPTQWAKGYLVNYFGDNFKPYVTGSTTELPLGPYEKHNWIRQLTPNPNDINISYTTQSLSSHANLGGYNPKLLPETFRADNAGSRPYEEVYPRKYYTYGFYIPYPYSSQNPLRTGDPCEKTVPYINGKLGYSNLDIPVRWRLPTISEGEGLRDAINSNVDNIEVKYNDDSRLIALTYYPNSSHIGVPDSWFNNAMIFYLDGYIDLVNNNTNYPSGYADVFDDAYYNTLSDNTLVGFRGSEYAFYRSADGSGSVTYQYRAGHTSAIKPPLETLKRKSSVNIRLKDGELALNSTGGNYDPRRNITSLYKKVLRISYDEDTTPKIKAEIILLHQGAAVEVRCVRNGL